MQPCEFKMWLDNCISNAKINGLTDNEILIEFMEQTRLMLIKKSIESCAKRS